MIRLFLILISAYGVFGDCPVDTVKRPILNNQTSAHFGLATNPSSEDISPNLLVLKSGRVLTTWLSYDDEEYIMKGQLRESDGTLVGDALSLLYTEYYNIPITSYNDGFLIATATSNDFLLFEYDHDGVLLKEIVIEEQDGKPISDIHFAVFSDGSLAIAYTVLYTLHVGPNDYRYVPNERVQWFHSDLTKRGNATVSPRYDPKWDSGYSKEMNERIVGAVALEDDRLLTFIWTQSYSGFDPFKNLVYYHVYAKNGTLTDRLILNEAQSTEDYAQRYTNIKAHPGGFVAQKQNEITVFTVHSNLTVVKGANLMPDDLKTETYDVNLKILKDGSILATYKRPGYGNEDRFSIALYSGGQLSSGPYLIDHDLTTYYDYVTFAVSGNDVMVVYQNDDYYGVYGRRYKLEALCDEVCTKEDYLVVAPNATAGQDCEPLTVCQSNEVETKAPVYNCVNELPKTVVFGCTDPNAMNYDPNALFNKDYFVGEPEGEGGYGYAITIDFNPNPTTSAPSTTEAPQERIVLLHTDCLYESCAKAPFNGCLENNTLWINASCSNVEYYKNNPGPSPPIPIGTLQNCTSLHNGSMTEITLKVGCKDPKASNYDPSANVFVDSWEGEDGFECEYASCEDAPVAGCIIETDFYIDRSECDNPCPIPTLCNESDAPALSDRVCFNNGTEAPTEAPTKAPTEAPTEAPEDTVDIGVIIGASVGGVLGVGLGIWAVYKLMQNGRKPRINYQPVDTISNTV